MIDGLTNSGSVPVLERAMQFAARRQELIAHNIANISTPKYQHVDVSVEAFQRSMGEALDRRRAGGNRAAFELESTREVRVGDRGLELTPRTGSGGVLFHDRNNRDLERLMQAMVENLTVFRVASDLLKSRMDLLNQAIRERF